MKTRVFSFQHEGNGLALQLLAETEAEDALLNALWAFGTLERGYPPSDESSRANRQSYLVRAFCDKVTDAKGDKGR